MEQVRMRGMSRVAISRVRPKRSTNAPATLPDGECSHPDGCPVQVAASLGAPGVAPAGRLARNSLEIPRRAGET